MHDAFTMAAGMVAFGLIGGWLAGTCRWAMRLNDAQQVKTAWVKSFAFEISTSTRLS